MAEEVLCAREFTSEDARSAAITVWSIHYDYHRPHSTGASSTPPQERHQRRALIQLGSLGRDETLQEGAQQFLVAVFQAAEEQGTHLVTDP